MPRKSITCEPVGNRGVEERSGGGGGKLEGEHGKSAGFLKVFFKEAPKREERQQQLFIYRKTRPTVLITAHYMRLKALVEFQVKKVCILIIKSERGGVSY